NLGVGENGLHTEYRAILDYLGTRALKTSITSNGLSIEALDDDAVKRFHSVELSLDFPTERDHDAFRGAGNWRTVMGALERCVALGVPVTVTSVMMSINYDRLADLARLAAGFGAHLRVNTYQPAKTDPFTLTYEQFWRGVRLLSGATRLVATTEPVLPAALGAPDLTGPGCGRSTVRVAPDGRPLPSPSWPASRPTPGRAPVVATLPRSLYLETANRRDSKCQTCIRTFQGLERPADLTLAQVKAIAEQCPVLKRVVLHGIGEPLLNA